MSIQATIRDIANTSFSTEDRSKAISLAVASVLVLSSQRHIADVNSSEEYDASFARAHRSFISELNESVLFDVRYATDLTRRLYDAFNTMKHPTLTHVRLSALPFPFSLFGIDQYLNSQEIECFNTNAEGIVKIINLFTSSEAVENQDVLFNYSQANQEEGVADAVEDVVGAIADTVNKD